jgi:signal transduction histidine kinase
MAVSSRFPLSVRILFPLATSVAMAAPGPYKVDSATLHLWHLDEPHTPAIDAVPGGKPMLSLHNGAVLGAKGFPGFGTSLMTFTNAAPPENVSQYHGGILLAAARLASNQSDNVTPPFRYFGPDGAFTMEALVNFTIMPEDAPGVASMILSMDDDDVNVRRIFHFRIEKSGHVTFTPLPGSGATGGGYGRLPGAGPHAMATAAWFHVAVTYDGNGGSNDNLKLYWTRLDSDAHEANLIGTGTLSADLSGDLGDFAIGNEARQYRANGESEPFPGRIDEVRISSIARSADDFLFSPLAGGNARPQPSLSLDPVKSGGVSLHIDSLRVNGKLFGFPGDGQPMTLPTGLHRLDFGFRHVTGPASGPVKVRCQLAGAEEGWQDAARGMFVMCQFLDTGGKVVAQSVFPVLGTSPGWEGTIEDSTLLPRREPLMVPGGASSIRVTLSSGVLDTTGTLAIDNLTVMSGGDDTENFMQLWPDGNSNMGSDMDRPTGTPEGWTRGGGDPSISRLAISSKAIALALVDGDAGKSGEWVSLRALDKRITSGQTLILAWMEAYNVIGGQQHMASYLNVPPGEYVFRATAITTNGSWSGGSASLPLRIPPPLIQRPWFGPLLAAFLVTIVSVFVFLVLRQRSRLRMERLRLQTELERDRTRIAQDMHDDLGTMTTAITMTASLARRNLTHNPKKADEHLETVCRSARKLVTSMDELVWAVDPANDTLDELGVHLTRLIEEIFRGSGIRHRIAMPATLPATPLGSETRHHLSLAVKEALHNVLRHASADEVVLSMECGGGELVIEVTDNGSGFDPAIRTGHGLINFQDRLQRIGGLCRIDSTPGTGTTVRFQIPLSLAKA